MMFNLDLYEKSVASRHAEILKEVQQARLVAQVDQKRTFVRYAAYSIGKSLIVLGSYMQHAGQKGEASLRTS